MREVAGVVERGETVLMVWTLDINTDTEGRVHVFVCLSAMVYVYGVGAAGGGGVVCDSICAAGAAAMTFLQAVWASYFRVGTRSRDRSARGVVRSMFRGHGRRCTQLHLHSTNRSEQLQD